MEVAMSWNRWCSFVVFALAVAGIGPADEGSVPRLEQRREVVIGNDDRVRLSAAMLAGAESHLRAVGRLGGCSATKITSTTLISAAHCFGDHPDPTSISFSPASVPGQPNAVIGIRQIIKGSGATFTQPCASDGNCASGQCDTVNNRCVYFEGGADFALLEVEPSTFSANGSTLTPTWASVPTAELVADVNPPPSGGIPVSAVGYSGDLQGFNGLHRNCRLVSRGSGFQGMYFSDCDTEGGASGGAVFRFSHGAKETQLTGIVSGHGSPFNRISDTLTAYWSPWKPGGVTAVLNADGRVHAYASDQARWNQMMLRAQTTTSGQYQRRFDQWRDVRGGLSVPTPGRASSVLYDSRQFIFMVGSDQRVYANWQAVPSGNLLGWATYFGGDPIATSVLDVASDTSDNILFQYLLRSTGLVLKRKTGGHTGPWQAWQNILVSNSFTKVAANNTQGFPVAILASSSLLFVTWSNDTTGTAWVAPQNFAQVGQAGGLPSGACYLDVELGTTLDGKLDAFVLLHEGCNPASPAIWRRTKTTAIAGSAWGDWFRYRSLAGSLSAPGVALGVPNPVLAGATGLGLLPNDAARGDGLLLISRGNIYSSFWGSSTNFVGWVPFYGPNRFW
jgi:V8-like Glu-specific endopeptidase